MFVKSVQRVKQPQSSIAHMLTAGRNNLFGFVSNGHQAELMQLSAKMLEVQESERRRIATELHDVLGQSLTMIRLSVEESVQLLDADDVNQTAESLQRLKQKVKDALEDLRRVSMDLRPAMLDDLGILPTLSCFFREFETVCRGVKVEKRFNIKEDSIPDPLKIIIFRIIQEATNNIVKHAHADLIRVNLNKTGSTLHLSIEDNGDGFEPPVAGNPRSCGKGLGLLSMKERAELSGGSYAMKSALGEGTRIDVSWRIGMQAVPGRNDRVLELATS